MISLIIPTTSTNQNYTDNIVNNIREFYPNENEVEIIVEVNDNVNLGENYNNAVAKANGEKIILLHNDMVIKPGFIEEMDKHIAKNRVTTYTRVEPPIYTDTYPGKVLLDCGSDLETFNKKKFEEFQVEESLIDGCSQLFFGCLKEDYIGLDTQTFNPPQMWCSDDDLHLRYKLAGFEHKVSSAHVYHFVSKTSRSTNDYQRVELHSNRNFVRKWGSRNPKVKYNTAFVIHNCNLQLLEILEPWCDRIYIDEVFTIGRMQDYIEIEQSNTKFNLSKRVLTIKNNDPIAENDIVVEFDATQLNQNNFQLIQQLPEIIHESGEIGEFELDIFKITINSLEQYQNNLIFIEK
jgi:GT2 family glycosyltransferase